MIKRGLLVVFSGPSGVGKGTVMKRFRTMRPDCVLSVSATTREPRPGEEEGVDYHYISHADFEEKIRRGEMLEYAAYDNNYYGTIARQVEDQLAAGKNVILEIETQGSRQIRKLRPDAVFVFLLPPSWECLRARLEGRGTQTPQSMEKRLRVAREEIREASDYDYVIINDDLDECCQHLSAVITAAGFSAGNMKEFIEEVSTHA